MSFTPSRRVWQLGNEWPQCLSLHVIMRLCGGGVFLLLRHHHHRHHHHPKRWEEGGGVHTMRSWMTQGGGGILGGGVWQNPERGGEEVDEEEVERGGVGRPSGEEMLHKSAPFFPSLLFTLLSVLPERLCSFYFCHHYLRSPPYHILPFSSSFFLFIELFLLPSPFPPLFHV